MENPRQVCENDEPDLVSPFPPLSGEKTQFRVGLHLHGQQDHAVRSLVDNKRICVRTVNIGSTVQYGYATEECEQQTSFRCSRYGVVSTSSTVLEEIEERWDLNKYGISAMDASLTSQFGTTMTRSVVDVQSLT
jgi:hypothetical protein